jgi:hypothetical protein
MNDERSNVVIVFLASSVLLLWTVLPEGGLIKPFPLSEQEIHFQTYIWIATVYAAFLMMTWVMYRLSDKAKDFFNAVFILQALQFVEFFLNYNETWVKIGWYPVTIATLRFPLLFFFAVRTFIKWKT